MKKTMAILFTLFLFGCSEPRTINGIYCETYGLLNEDEHKDPRIRYRLVTGNLVWAIVLSETIVAPIYFVGYDLYEPIGMNEGFK